MTAQPELDRGELEEDPQCSQWPAGTLDEPAKDEKIP